MPKPHKDIARAQAFTAESARSEPSETETANQTPAPAPQPLPPITPAVIDQILQRRLRTRWFEDGVDFRLYFVSGARKIVTNTLDKDQGKISRMLQKQIQDPSAFKGGLLQSNQSVADEIKNDKRPLASAPPDTLSQVMQHWGSHVPLQGEGQLAAVIRYRAFDGPVLAADAAAQGGPIADAKLSSRLGPSYTLDDVDFLSALFDGVIVDLAVEFGEFLTDLGVSFLPIIPFLRSSYKAAKTGYDAAKVQQRLSQGRTQTGELQSGASKVSDRLRQKTAGASAVAAKSILELLATQRTGLAITCGSYVVDVTVGTVDPTPATRLLMAAGRTGGAILHLYNQWKGVQAANNILRDPQSQVTQPAKAALDHCPILGCYMFLDFVVPKGVRQARRGGADGSGTVDDSGNADSGPGLQSLHDQSGIEKAAAEEAALRPALEHLKESALKLISKSPVKLQVRVGPAGLWQDALPFVRSSQS
jgi:hypothetical protein